VTPAEQLTLISLAWGKQDGYCFFPWIDGDADTKEERIQSYHEGPAFHWPEDRPKILEHMKAHTDDDLYWCPSLFEQPKRRTDQAMDEHCLWADLDEVDPRHIDEEYKPTICWETSPGRFQALWLIQRGFDIQGASWAGGENQRLTSYLEADQSGWDTTQLLRIPGWKNHKPQYRDDDGKPPEGKLIWWDKGRRYLPDHFSDLPEIDSATVHVRDVLEDEINRVDRHKVWGRVRLKVNKAVRDYMGAREIAGDRSEILWQIERELADAGCSVVEIVALVRPTPWNKYSGRADELKRLTAEAAKAVDHRPEEVADKIEADLEGLGDVETLDDVLRDLKPPEWLIDKIWIRGGCGFIAGEPKSFKSWLSLDMAISLATGSPFLGEFSVARPGPVLLLLEEDGPRRVKSRRDKIWPSKQADRLTTNEQGQLVWEPSSKLPQADIAVKIKKGFQASNPSHQSWLDEALEKGYPGTGAPFQAVILDPFLMMLGDVDENRAGELNTKIFKPLKDLADKHDIAIIVVHHLRKNNAKSGAPIRGGQLMLGSVAFHGWTDSALYVTHARGDLHVEVESKDGSGGNFKLTGLRRKGWTPLVTDLKLEVDEEDEELPEGSTVRTASTPGESSKATGPKARRKMTCVQALKILGGKASTVEIGEEMGLTSRSARNQLDRAEKRDEVVRLSPTHWGLP
jgi:hypothetical protein